MATTGEGYTPLYLNSDEKERPLQEIVPWMTYVTDYILLNKDGSLLAGFEYSALDPDNIDDETVDRAVDELERAINANFDERITLWWNTKRKRTYSYLRQSFTNEVSARLDAAYSKRFRGGYYFRMHHWLFVLYTGNTGVDGVMDRARHLSSEENMSMPAAYMKASVSSMSTNEGLLRDRNQLELNVKAFEQILGAFVGTTPALSLRPLAERDLDNALFQILNPASENDVVERPKDVMLDGWMPANSVVVGRDVIRFTGNRGDRYAAVYGAKQWPTASHPMILEGLFKSDNELVVSQIVRCMGKERSEKELTEVRNFLKMTQYTVFSTLMAKATGRKPEPAPGKADLVKDAESALKRLTKGGPNSAYYNLSIMVFDHNREVLERRCARIERILADKRLIALRERENLGPSYVGMLPGQWAFQSRYILVANDNVADLAPIYTMNPGPAVHVHFSEVLKRRVPAHAMFVDAYGCQFRWVPHVGQVGHAILIAPTESGKTTFVNFCLSQFQKYVGYEGGGVNTFIFDRDESVKITTLLHKGKHLDYKSGTMLLNPFKLDGGTEFGRTWVREFIIRMLKESGYQTEPEDTEQIDKVLARMYEESFRNPRTLSTFAGLVSPKISTALGEWLNGRPYGIFDNEENNFTLESWTCIEMKELTAIPRLFELFMEYAFRTIDLSLDGRPTFIYLEEASFLLQIEGFAKKIVDWLKTFRKKNAFVWLTVQSPDAISGSIRADLIDNIKTTILMYNKRVNAHRRFYKENFSLTDAQIDRIGRLVPKKEYMFVQDNFTRVVQTVFTDEVLPYLRSEKHLQNVFLKHQATEGTNPNWLDDYVAEVATIKPVDYSREPEEETDAQPA
ncbi:conjugal transfer protein TraC [Paraburkholderia sp. J8-2]|uniref:VirB4 family type IV secretion system protein n=1 Tax=Paraburkholderia sp. J8-2 TaxID=2805440 RepID=UPI002AB6D139|nr:conjugal transfer protein TraC [Paraburkholderia sp. J8-2]